MVLAVMAMSLMYTRVGFEDPLLAL
jgi:hypothetical protein